VSMKKKELAAVVVVVNSELGEGKEKYWERTAQLDLVTLLVPLLLWAPTMAIQYPKAVCSFLMAKAVCSFLMAMAMHAVIQSVLRV
jgi:hypothetical protein